MKLREIATGSDGARHSLKGISNSSACKCHHEALAFIGGLSPGGSLKKKKGATVNANPMIV